MWLQVSTIKRDNRVAVFFFSASNDSAVQLCGMFNNNKKWVVVSRRAAPIIWCFHSREVYCFVIVQTRTMKNMKNINEYYLVIMFIFMTVHWSGEWTVKKDLQKMKFHPHFYARAIQMVWIKRFVKRTLHLRALRYNFNFNQSYYFLMMQNDENMQNNDSIFGE